MEDEEVDYSEKKTVSESKQTKKTQTRKQTPGGKIKGAKKKTTLCQARTLDPLIPSKAIRNKKNNPYRDSVFGIG